MQHGAGSDDGKVGRFVAYISPWHFSLDIRPWRLLSDNRPLLSMSELGVCVLSRTMGRVLLVGKQCFLVGGCVFFFLLGFSALSVLSLVSS